MDYLEMAAPSIVKCARSLGQPKFSGAIAKRDWRQRDGDQITCALRSLSSSACTPRKP